MRSSHAKSLLHNRITRQWSSGNKLQMIFVHMFYIMSMVKQFAATKLAFKLELGHVVGLIWRYPVCREKEWLCVYIYHSLWNCNVLLTINGENALSITWQIVRIISALDLQVNTIIKNSCIKYLKQPAMKPGWSQYQNNM